MKQREIKFRCYNKKLKSMGSAFPFQIIIESFYSRELNPHDQKDCIMMQYTGLKDKNGVEIYESDVLQASESIIVIEYRGRGYEGKFIDPSYKYESPIQNNNYLHWEVIGNIYENPDLIQ